jgi:diguanylate cyclase (GGDEF)-like protein/PAS domain S-box-containing protein
MEQRPSSRTVLLIESDREEAHLIHEILNDSTSCVFAFTHLESMSDAERYLADRSVDIVLLDLGSGELPRLEAVRRVRAAASRTPVVLLCSAGDEEIAKLAVREGAQDYVMKGAIEPQSLIRTLLNSVARKMFSEALFIENERAQETLECIGDAVICTDCAGDLTFLNPVAEEMTGWTRPDAVGRPMSDTFRVVDALTREPIADPMAKATSQDRAGKLPSNSVLIRRDGHEVFIEDSVAPIRDHEGRVTGAVIVFRDVTATRTLEERLTHSAEHDFLTGLPNRMLLDDRISQAIALAHRNRGETAVLFLDLDGFKHINDSLGHHVGDKLLRSVATRLLASVRAPDTVSRLGGDEFVVLIQELQHSDAAGATAERLLKAVAKVHLIDQHEIRLTTSVGLSLYPNDAQDAETLIKHADIAMYHAKKKGRQTYEFFKPEMLLDSAEHLPKEAALRAGEASRAFRFSTKILPLIRKSGPR